MSHAVKFDDRVILAHRAWIEAKSDYHAHPESGDVHWGHDLNEAEADFYAAQYRHAWEMLCRYHGK